MSKMLKFHEDALNSVIKGVKALAKAVSVTLGPRGRNVIINKEFGSPLSTKDGVTVAKEVILKNKFENMGAALIKGAASKTADEAGDGTTTAIVLANAMAACGVKNVIGGANPMAVKRGIEQGAKTLCDALSSLAKQVGSPEDIKDIATIAANNNAEIGDMIAQVLKTVGKDGTITIKEGQGIETVLDVVEGMQFDKGYTSSYFITNGEKMSVEMENAQILITDKKLSSAKQLIPFLEQAMEAGNRPLLIIAEDVDAEALATLVVNKLKGGMRVCAVKAPAFGDRRRAMLQDIAILTGATVVSEEVGLRIEEVGLDVLGSAKNITITKEETIIVGGCGDPKVIEGRAAQIRAEIEASTSEYDKEQLSESLAKISGGVGVIQVGAGTEAEMKEKKARVEDALHATRAAVREGIVPGGGVALIRAAKSLDCLKLSPDEMIGVAIVREAAYAPATAIADNCGLNGAVIAEKIAEKEGNDGFNGLTGTFSDLLADGIVDPVLVTKSAVMNAASIAGILITISCMITDQPKAKTAAPAMPSMDGMGGMPGMGGGMPGMGGMGGMPEMGF